MISNQIKKLFFALLTALVTMLYFGGCATIERGSDFGRLCLANTTGEAVEQVVVSNYGYYLFNIIPVFSGDTDSLGDTAWFRDHVTIDRLMNLVNDEAKQAGGKQYLDIQVRTENTCWFSAIPYIGNSLGLVWYKEIQISAFVVAPKGEKDKITGRRSTPSPDPGHPIPDKN